MVPDLAAEIFPSFNGIKNVRKNCCDIVDKIDVRITLNELDPSKNLFVAACDISTRRCLLIFHGDKSGEKKRDDWSSPPRSLDRWLSSIISPV